MSLTLLSDEAARPAAARHRSLIPVGQLVDGVARAGDLCIVVAAGLGAYSLRSHQVVAPSQEATVALAVALLLAANVFSLFRLYDPTRLGSLMEQWPRLCGAWCATMASVVVVLFLLATTDDLSRLWVIYWFVFGGLGLALSRVALKAWIKRAQRAGELTRNLLVVGTGPGLSAYGEQVERHDRATRIAGRLLIDDLIDPATATVTADGVRRLEQHLLGQHIDHVAVALPDDRVAVLPALLRVLRHFPVEVGLVPQLPAGGLPVVGVKQIGGVPSVLLLEKPLDGWHWVVKAAEDRLLAGLILLFIAPLMLAIAIAVRATSPGPVLFRQKRLGFNQQLVDVYKFRSMYQDRCDTDHAATIVQATRGDPRVTPVGWFLRKTSLDELPQLINVLVGDMSLVGPRPHAVAHDRYYAELIDGYLGRHRVKPGITGWAQVNGFRGETRTLDEMRQRIEFDLHYIDNWSLLFDLRIIARTLFVGFVNAKAY